MAAGGGLLGAAGTRAGAATNWAGGQVPLAAAGASGLPSRLEPPAGRFPADGAGEIRRRPMEGDGRRGRGGG